MPDPSAAPTHLRLLTYTCAGGSPTGGRYLPNEIRHRLFARAMSFAPDAVIANGDHIYWDLKPPLGDFDLVRPIQPMVKSVDVATLAVIRYDIDDEGWDDLVSSLEHSLACVYRQQIPEALAALQQHYYSSAGFFEDLLRWSPSDQNSSEASKQRRIQRAIDYTERLVASVTPPPNPEPSSSAKVYVERKPH